MSVVENTTVSGQVSSDGTPINVVFPATQEIQITNTSDSIAVGTSSQLFTGTTVSGKFGLDVNLIGGTVTTMPGGTQDVNIVSSITLPVSGPLTDAQLRASPPQVIANSGTGTFLVDGSAHTQPISATSLPLPAGAATSALQTTGNTSLASIDSKLTSPITVTGPLTNAQLRATPVPISGTVSLTTESIEIGTVDQGTGGASPWLTSSADTTATFSFTAINQDHDISCVGLNTVRFLVTGTWVGTIDFYTSVDGTTLDPAFAFEYEQPNITDSSTTVNGTWIVDVTGAKILRFTTGSGGGWTSGTAVVTANANSKVTVLTGINQTVGVTGTVFIQTSDRVALNAGQQTMANSLPVVIASNQTAVPISGTVTANAGTGTFAVSAASLPLPTGAATAALQTTGNNELTTINTTLGSPFQAGGAISNTAFIANAGTNLNTSALALESGGHLASIDTKTPALGQALNSASVPVVLTAAQLTTLTPLSTIAVTNSGTFAVQAALNAETTKVIGTVNQGTSPWVVSGTVTANAGTNLNTSALALDASVNGLLLAQAATSTAQKGPLIQAVSTTAAPSYSDAKVNPLSLTLAGNLRVDGSTVTQPVSGTVTANAGTGTFAISAVSLPLPTGAATSAIQQTANATLSTINTTLGSPFQFGGVIGNTTFASTIADGANITFGTKTDAKNSATDATSTTAMQVLKQISASVQAPPSQAVTNAGTFAVQATLAAETTKVIGAVNQGTSPWVVSGNVTNLTQGTVTDRSGTATGSSTTMMAANSSRKFLLIQVTGTKGIWINFTTAAVNASPSIFIAPNTTFQMEGSFVSTEAITVIRDSSPNLAFTAKEG